MSTENQPERRRRNDIDLQELVQQTVRSTVAELHQACLTPDEQQFVRMAIAREARRAKLHQAIIEKSLAGLVWSALAGVGYLVVEWLKNPRGVH